MDMHAVELVHRSILILGASGRAAAASARRSSFVPVVIDQFGDTDTHRLATTMRCPMDAYPSGLVTLASTTATMPFIYTGGLENRPDLIGELARSRELWGNPPEVLALVRDPFRLQQWCINVSIGFPQTFRQINGPTTGQWLRKPLASGGGLGIAFTNSDVRHATENCIFQEFLAGQPMSAIFASDGRSLELLGITHQLIGQNWLHTQHFNYCGTIGPDDADQCLERELLRIASFLVEFSGLRGVWGIDFLNDTGRIVLLEINPRYTASIEVLEHQIGLQSFDWIRWAFVGGTKPSVNRISNRRVVGKAIYFTQHDMLFPNNGPWINSRDRSNAVLNRSDFADIPHPGEEIPRGFPVLTILEEAETRANCLKRLQSRAGELDHLFSFEAPETVP